jgi:acyl-CoA synthetase (AMP-forming)/AMP-acid ligase II
VHTPYFKQQLANKPDELAITNLDESRSWRTLDKNIATLAQFLRDDAGLLPGDHIALLVGNRIEFVEAMLAATLSGLWVTPINTHLTSNECDYIRRDSGAKIIFFDDEHAHLLVPDSTGTVINIHRLLAEISDREITWTYSAQDPAGGNMLYTSGTTGKPKGVKRAKPNTVMEMVDRLRHLGKAFGLTGHGPHLVTGPLYHAAPSLLAMYDMINGAPMIIMPKWSCETFFDCVAKFQVATTHLVPTMFVRLLDHKENNANNFDLSSLQYVLHGAAPISPSVKQAVLDWLGPILTEYWGATESGIVTLTDSAAWLSHPGTVGKAIDNFDIFIGDAEGNPIAEKEGLLLCRHRHLSQVFSYHQDPEKTRAAHPQPFVFSLGDIGRIDEDGYVYLSDRESNMIISGGVNIYPREVELALMEHEDIADAAVFGIPNHEWGEEIKAVVQLREGIVATTDSVEKYRSFVRSRIASFKVPRSIEFIAELPRNPTGKVLIRQLKEKFRN